MLKCIGCYFWLCLTLRKLCAFCSKINKKPFKTIKLIIDITSMFILFFAFYVGNYVKLCRGFVQACTWFLVYSSVLQFCTLEKAQTLLFMIVWHGIYNSFCFFNSFIELCTVLSCSTHLDRLAKMFWLYSGTGQGCEII